MWMSGRSPASNAQSLQLGEVRLAVDALDDELRALAGGEGRGRRPRSDRRGFLRSVHAVHVEAEQEEKPVGQPEGRGVTPG